MQQLPFATCPTDNRRAFRRNPRADVFYVASGSYCDLFVFVRIGHSTSSAIHLGIGLRAGAAPQRLSTEIVP